jgi:hypothetical protein
MSYPINYPTPQGANIQIFYKTDDWVKPQGASFVWFTLLGAGAGSNLSGTVGGGSGAVTNCMVPAFLIPDTLRVIVGAGGVVDANGGQTSVEYQQKAITGYPLLVANGAINTGGGNATGSNNFSAMGFFQSITGQDGGNPSVSASATTFLSGGSYGGQTTANYGYTPTNIGKAGFFMMQPIIVGSGGSDVTGTNPANGGIGCGGGGTTGKGGDGLVVIITW